MNKPFKVIDGLTLPAKLRELLRPAEQVTDHEGHTHSLPRFFYEIETWAKAKETQMATHFTAAEIMTVDCREADLLLNHFPHYVPCAVSIAARYLQAFREKVEAPVYISANGGYRSPAHARSRGASLHHWGTAADIYRVGDTFLDDQKSIEKYAGLAEAIAPEVYAKPFGHGAGETDDHLHIDLGYVNYTPRACDEAL
ncbi:MAG: hypothetical protein QOD99_3028 [Chthoniobacter sp.]|jgi:hypothetical protein|nr:hypothetical protein [Chthoniobacter sp.]